MARYEDLDREAGIGNPYADLDKEAGVLSNPYAALDAEAGVDTSSFRGAGYTGTFEAPEGAFKRFMRGVGLEYTGMKGVGKIPLMGWVTGAVNNLETIEADKRLKEDNYQHQYRTREFDSPLRGGVESDDQTPVFTAEQRKELDEKQVARATKEAADVAALGTAGAIGSGVGQVPDFVVQMMMTSGLNKLGSATVRAKLRRYFGDYASTTAGRGMLRAAGWSAGAVTRASVGLPAVVGKQASQRQVEVQLGMREDESATESLAKAYWQTVFEVASEAAGGSKFVGRVLENKTKLGKVLIPALEKSWIAATGGTKGTFARKMMSKAGRENILSEFGEERLSSLLNATFNTGDYDLPPDADLGTRIKAALVQDMDNLGVEVGVLSIVGGGQVALGQGINAVKKWDEGSEARHMKRMAKLEEKERKFQLKQVKEDEKAFIADGLRPSIARKMAWRMQGKEAPTFELTEEGQAEVNRINEKLNTGKKLTAEEEDMLEIMTSPTDVEVANEGATMAQMDAVHRLSSSMKQSPEEYQQTLMDITGKESMTKMDQNEADALVDYYLEAAKQKGVLHPEQALQRRKVRGNALLRMFVPQDFVIEKAGLGFLLNPARKGKRRHHIEFQKVQRKNEEMIRRMNKIGGETWRTKVASVLGNKPTTSAEFFYELLDTNETAPEWLNKEETEIFNYFRTLTDSLLERENAVRAELGQDLIDRHEGGYIRHIASQEAQDIIDGNRPVPNLAEYWYRKHAPLAVSNPTEFHRKLTKELADNVFTKDLGVVADAMAWTSLKEIHLNEPLKYFDQMKKMYDTELPAHWRAWAEEYIREMVVGHMTDIDKRWNKQVAEGGIGSAMNMVLKRFNRRIGHTPLTSLFSKLAQARILGVLGPRPKQVIRNKFQLLQNLMLYDVPSVIKSYMVRDDVLLEELMRESEFYEAYGGHEAFATMPKKFTDKWLKLYQWSATSNVNRSMRVAYFQARKWCTERKFKRYGWADPQRTYNEPAGFLYDSEVENIRREMEFGAGVTQFSYAAMDMPQIFRYRVGKPVTGLQSWWMSYFSKFLTEGLNRSINGKTGTGMRVPAEARIGALRYLVVSGAILETMGYGRSFLLGVAPGQPQVLELVLSLYQLALNHDDERARTKAQKDFMDTVMMFMPTYLTVKDVYKYMTEEDGLPEMFFYNGGVFTDESKEGKKERRKVQARRKPQKRRQD